MLTTPVDVWNLETFDGEHLALLQSHGTLLREYELTSRKNYNDQQAADQWVPLKENPFAADRMHVLEQVIMPTMEQLTIRLLQLWRAVIRPDL
ncbi:hypothetical protein [Brucella pseudogrignonensis]|uniref:hypothetical protein n=1 Tax=Brucella pseudogrignonensis TaxID=419475 RepID=UPI0038D205E3